MSIEFDYYDNSKVDHSDFYNVLAEALEKCQGSFGFVKVHQENTTYVLDGRLFTIQSFDKAGNPHTELKFWVGVNDRRLFYITYIEDHPDQCREIFKFCFGGAEKVGWDISYEDILGHIPKTTSVWGTCMSPDYLVERPRPGHPEELTRAGRFWAVDIAMMCQSQIRCMERFNLTCSPFKPEPL